MRSFILSLALVLSAGGAMAQGWGVTIPNLQFPPQPDPATRACIDQTVLTDPACTPDQ